MAGVGGWRRAVTRGLSFGIGTEVAEKMNCFSYNCVLCPGRTEDLFCRAQDQSRKKNERRLLQTVWEGVCLL